MAEDTSTTVKVESGLIEPVIVLVEPQMGVNIGSAMRAMCNFGLRRMRLVNPRDGWPNAAATSSATGSARVLENAELYDTTAEAVEDCSAVYATTARPRGLTKRVLSPEDAMVEVRTRAKRGERVAILFGPERTGLSNTDIILSTAIITAPVDPEFTSLNLAQCVLLVSYEWTKSANTERNEHVEERADAGMVTKFLDNLIKELDKSGCFFTNDKKPAMAKSVQNIFRRAPLTNQDVSTLWRVVRTLSGNRKQRIKDKSPEY